MKKFVLSTLAVVTMHAALANSALAESGAAEASRASQEQSIPGGTLAVAAYVVLWVLVFGMVFVTMRRQSKLNGDIDELEKRMDEVFEDVTEA